MIDNPIVEEIHRIREEMLAEFNGDLRALMKHAQERTRQSQNASAVSPSVSSRPTTPHVDEAKRKVG